MNRRRREPSERNRQIWKAVRVERREQEDVAREHKISQPRVSQIVRRMAAWYAEHSPEVIELADLAARSRLAEVEYRAQVEQCLTEAMRALARSQQPLVTKKERRTKTIEGDVVVREVVVEETTAREQPVSTRAITLVGKHARELWELAGGKAGTARRAEPERTERLSPAQSGPAEPAEPAPVAWDENEDLSIPPPCPYDGRPIPEHEIDDPVKAYQRRKQAGRFWVHRRLGQVCTGDVRLEGAEACNYHCAKTSGSIYPSLYEKNADGITFSVAPWVHKVVPPEHLHGPERQPVYTVHDIADWEAWCNGDERLWNETDAACEARWRAWSQSVQGSAFAVQEVGSQRSEFGEADVGSACRAESEPPSTPAAPRGASGQEEAAKPRQATVIERRLASGRWMSSRERRRLELVAGVRRERLEQTS